MLLGYSDRPQTIRCSDEHNFAFRETTDERSDHDCGDDKQSEESSDAEVINGDADDTKETVAHDTQMRYSPSILPENTQACVETDVNRPKEKGQPVMEGTQLRSVQQTATQATRQACVTSLQDFVHSGARLRGGSIQEGREGCRSGVLE